MRMNQFLIVRCKKRVGAHLYVIAHLVFFFLFIETPHVTATTQEGDYSSPKERSQIEILNTILQQSPFRKIVQVSQDRRLGDRGLQDAGLQEKGPQSQGAEEKDSLAQSTSCKKDDFESVVDKAAGVLRELNFKNKPHFQEKLKLLKDQRGWSDGIFEKEAVRFVKDEEIDRFDSQTLDLLAKITAMGDEGSAANVPDCALLQKLQNYMTDLIKTQTDKWSYMSQKIDAEMTKE